MDYLTMNNAVDRLSGLPSPLLDHILSLLPIKDVIRTCVLSKSWRNVWCFVPSFHFDDRNFSGVEADFVKFVDFALFLRDGSTIRKLSLTLGTKKSLISNYTMCSVNKWIVYAIRHNVEVLEILNLMQWTPSHLGSISQIFTSKSLREIRLTSYPRCIKLPASCWLPSLKFLQFSYMEMTTFESSAFPSLETLIMKGCYFGSKSLRISFPQLKNLNFKGVRWLLGSCLKVLEISVDTPNLISLELKIPYKMVKFVEFNIISLVIANINLYPPCDLDVLIKLIRALESVRSLTLCVGILMEVQTQNVLSILARIETPFYNMKWLKIQTCFGDRDIGMINTLLKHSSQLETLLLEHELTARTTAKHCFEAEAVWFEYNLPHLKFVEIQGFKGSENEVKLTKFILKNAIVLEKLIITSYKAQEDSEQLCLLGVPKLSASEQKVASAVYLKKLERTGRNLFSSPRASQSVSILFI